MAKRYTLNYLLNKQPKSLKKSKDYSFLILTFSSSDKLKKLLISRKCYTLLNKAKIIPENLVYFYKTYRLPQDPFFPLFLKIKREYIIKRVEIKKKREEYVKNKIKNLPENTFRIIEYFAKIEMNLNPKKLIPVWRSVIYPKTKKRADQLCRFNKLQWTDLFYRFINELKIRYKNIDFNYCEKVICLFVLELPIQKNSKEIIKKHFRKLSFQCHPDAGGSSEDFNLIKKALKILSD